MARAASALFEPPLPSKTAPTTNLEGFPAYERPPKEQLLQTLLTNTLGSTYYETKQNLIDDTERVHTQALNEDPAFMAQALGYAREKGFFRTQPVYGLARVSALKDGEHFEGAFSRVVKTPNDLVDFASIIRSLRGGEGGRRIKRVAGSWLRSNLSEYWAIKYGSEKKTYALRDLFRTYHPRGEKSALVDYLLGHSDTDLSRLPQVGAFEALKKATTDAEKISAIAAGRLPHEVATSFAGGSKKVWESIIPNLPMFAMLRNLATLERHGVLDAAKERIVKQFGDPEQVRKSKVFPFRFLEAMKHVGAPWAKDACRMALEHSFANAEQIQGSTIVALDISGSMASYIEMAAIFAISTVRRSGDDSRFLVFDDRVEEFAVSKMDSVLSQAATIKTRGGTATHLVPASMAHHGIRVDNLILITDEQQNMGTPFMDKVAEYRRRVSPKCKVFVLNVAPYTKAALLNSADPLNYYVYGLTESALSFISCASRGWGKFVDHVANKELN